MSEETLNSQRLVKDYVLSVDGTEKVSINRQLIGDAQQASLRYKLYLEDKQKAKEQEEKQKKRKS